MSLFRFLLSIVLLGLWPVLAYAGEEILWRNLKPGPALDMMLLDDFEEKVPWKTGNSLGIASKLRFVEKNPADPDMHHIGKKSRADLYHQDIAMLGESAQVHGRRNLGEQLYSQELMVFFSNPGSDYQVIEVPEKDRKFISGRIIAVSMWVYGTGKKHALYALFSNQVQDKIPVKIGDLNFHGWKRMEASVPLAVAHRNRLNNRVYEFRFDGLKVASHPHESAGSFSLTIDLVSVLIDKVPDRYPGAKIYDDWK